MEYASTHYNMLYYNWLDKQPITQRKNINAQLSKEICVSVGGKVTK